MNKGERVPIRPVIVLLPLALLAALFFGACMAGRFPGPPSASASPATYDVVIRNGRVIDPESGLDAIRSVGISAGVIRAISSEPLAGRLKIDATGLVVAPGFIDVLWEMPPAYQRVQLLDGVTTALELWIGTDDVDRWYADREGNAVTNFGVAVGHERIRRAVMRDPGLPGSPGDAMHRAATDAESVEIRRNIERGLARGALGVSLTNVTPAASGWETLEAFRTARRAGAVVWAAPRETGNWDVDDMPRYLTELIGAAAVTGAELCIVHLQASGGPHTPRLLRIVEEAKAQGLDVTAEVFPYTSNISHISFVDAEDWRNWPNEWFRDLEWMATGERLTRETYARYREQDGQVIVHNDHVEPFVTEAVASPFTTIVSGAYLDEQGHGHPRASGTHARVLGHYVREKSVLSLGEALRKMTLMPAQRLERRVPAMKNKGRIREGTDADIVVFDAGRIIDRATFREPTRPSQGVHYVLINGVVVVRDGVIQEGVFAGQPLRAPFSGRRASTVEN
jgi:N-acyl-D-aspartate/D-glutamate deacylase